MSSIDLGKVKIGNNEALTIISGPCVIESLEACLQIGERMQALCEANGFQYIFKASFDKANRSSIHSERGPGLEKGLEILAAVKEKLGVPVTTDIHESYQCEAVGQVVDIMQLPAFLCRQTDLIVAAAKTGKAVNVKKGQFMSPDEMVNVMKKLEESDAAGIMLTERGTFFGYNRLVTDFIGLGDMMALGAPVCFDVTHSTQQPGGQGTKSGGRPDRAPLLAKAAVAAGVAALFIEAHPEPKNALSDAATMLSLAECDVLFPQIRKIFEVR